VLGECHYFDSLPESLASMNDPAISSVRARRRATPSAAVAIERRTVNGISRPYRKTSAKGGNPRLASNPANAHNRDATIHPPRIFMGVSAPRGGPGRARGHGHGVVGFHIECLEGAVG